MQVNVKIPARLGRVRADKTCVISLVNGGLQRLFLADVFAADIDVAGVGIHRERRDQAAFNQRMRVMAHDLAVFAGARLGLVGIDHQIGRTPVAFFRHKRPFQPRREARTTTPTQARGLHLVDNLVAPALDDLCRAIPMAALFGALQGAVMHPVEIGKDTVFICEHRLRPLTVIPARAPVYKSADQRPSKHGQCREVEQAKGACRPPKACSDKLNPDIGHCGSGNDQGQDPPPPGPSTAVVGARHILRQTGTA